MFLPHFGAAFAGKAAVRRPNLGWLIAACQLPDLLWPLFVLAGWERLAVDPGNTAYTPLDFQHYPWTHSLLMVVLWGAALAGLYFVRARDRRGAAVITLVAASHWVLDWISHRPDLPLVPWSDAKFGLGLWDNVAATLIVELGLFAAGVALYLRVTSARDRIGSVGLWVMIAFLLVTMIGAAFGPPPPGTTAVAGSAIALWLLVPLAAWVDRHRTPRHP